MTDEATARRRTIAVIAAALVIAPLATVAAVKLGQPEAVWAYCHLFGLCRV